MTRMDGNGATRDRLSPAPWRGILLLLGMGLLLVPARMGYAKQRPARNPLQRISQLEAQVAVLTAELGVLTAELEAERAAREAATAALQAALAAESDARTAADAGLQTGLDSEAAALTQEIADRQSADDALYVQACAYTDGEIETALGGLDPAELAALRTDLDVVQDTLAPLSTVADGAGGYDVYLVGANLHIENGQGSTGTANGLGNLIIGCNELGSRTAEDRTGSHNLVVGFGHGYTSYGGLIAGYRNYTSGPYSSVSGGRSNTASGSCSSVSGGRCNSASGPESSVSGGAANTASAWCSWVTGGCMNTASAEQSSVSGGCMNTASGGWSSVSGGRAREAAGRLDWVGGGLWQDQ